MKCSFVIGLLLAVFVEGFCQVDSLKKLLLEHPREKSDLYLKLAKAMVKADSDSSLFYMERAMQHAQVENNPDVYVKAIIAKAKEFDRQRESDSSKFYFDLLGKELLRPGLSLGGKASAYHVLASHLGDKDEFLLALGYLDTAAHLALQNTDSILYADALNRKGIINNNMGRRTQALDFFLQASDLYEHFQDYDAYGNTVNNIAVVYKKVGDFDNALVYYNESINLLTDLKNEDGAAVTRVNRGLLKKDMGRYEEALMDLHDALSVFKKDKYTFGVAACEHNLAETHIVAGNLDSALFYLSSSQNLAEPFEFWPIIVKNDLALAKVYQRLEQPATSNKTARKAYEIATAKGQLEDLRDLTRIISENYESLNRYGLSLRFFKEHKAVMDSIFDQSSREKLNLLRTEYDLKQKENEIKTLEAESIYQSSLAVQQRKLNYALVVGVALALVFILVLLFLYFRQRRLYDKLAEQKRMLTGLNQEKDDIMAMVAHDLRGPLNQIRGIMGLIKMDKSNMQNDQMVDLATQSADILRGRINRMLDVEAINAGKVNLVIQQVEVNSVLRFLRQHTYEDARKKQMKFNLQAEAGLQCLADENYLLQVLENLCSNAIKFSPRASEIGISAQSKDNHVLFTVEDQGPGIPKEEQSRLFTRYAQISTKPTENEKSTGLGLVIVKKYVEAMQGEVWFESRKEEGSIFYVKLPRAKAA